MAEIIAKLSMDPSGLLERIEALAEHVSAAPIGDPIADLAAEVGEIDASTDIRVTACVQGDAIVATFEPAGNLARMLDAFEARTS